MKFVMLKELPIVQRIIARAQTEILQETGIETSLHIFIDSEEHVNRKDRLKSLLKDIVCREYQVNWLDVLSSTREENEVAARHAYMYICEEVIELPRKDIAFEMGRDRTSVLYAVNKLKDAADIQSDEWLKVENIKNSLLEI